MKKPHIIILVIYAMLRLIVADKAVAQEKVVLQLRFDHQFQFAGYYAAQWKGYYKEAGLDVEIRSGVKPDGSLLSVIDELDSGRADFGIAAGEALIAIDRGIPLVLTASIFQQSPVEIFARRESDLSSPADLVNLRVQSGYNSLLDVELQAILKAEGMGNISLTRVPPPFTVEEYHKNLLDGKVDAMPAYTFSILWYAKERGIELTSLKPSIYGIDFYGDALFTHQRLVDAKPDVVERFVSASLKGWEYALANPDEIAEGIATNLPRTLPVKDLKAYNKFLAPHVKELTLYPIMDAGHINPGRWETMNENLKSAGLVSSNLDLNRFIFDPAKIRNAQLKKWYQIISFLLIALALAFLAFVINNRIRRRAEKNRALEALEASEQRFRMLAEQSLVGIIIYQKGRVVFANTAIAETLGYSAEEFVNLTPDQISNLIHPDDVPIAVARLADHRAGRVVPARNEYRAICRDGSIRWLEAFVTKLEYEDGPAILIALVDVTAQKNAEEALRKSEEQHRLLVETIPHGIQECDTDGIITYSNPAHAAMHGYDEGELKGKAIWDMLASDAERDALRDYLAMLAKDQPQPTIYFAKNKTKDGHIIDVQVDWTYKRDVEGKVEGFVSVITDVTERQLLEEQLRQAQKMEAIGRLAGGIAHDFNNLLTAINGYAELLLMKLPPGDRLRLNAEEILKAGSRAAMLTGQLLAFSRKQVLQPQVLDLNSVIRDSASMLRRLIGEDIELVAVEDPALELVRADPGQIEQVMMNLAINARDAMPEGGILTIETANVHLNEEDTLRQDDTQHGSYVMLAVTDTGMGMDEETRSRIFEPFFTTKEMGKGTGLGLATVYGIIKQSGGSIHVYSEEGKGTTFEIYLSAAKGSIEKTAAPPSAEAARGEETILLVEDEQTIRHLARDVLRFNGYTVLEAASGREALLISEQHPGPIHLMLTDVVMPQMKGPELARKLAETRPATKIVYMSGYTDDALFDNGNPDTETAFVQKPFTPGSLAKKVRETLDN